MKKVRILVVEDDVMQAEQLGLHLRSMDYEVMALLHSGEEALTYVRQHTPDVVILDIELDRTGRRMDGIETARQLRSSCDLPIIYLTGTREVDALDVIAQTRPEAFLYKPYLTQQVKLEIEKAIRQYSGRITEAATQAPSPPQPKPVPEATPAFPVATRQAFYVSDKGVYYRVGVDDIERIETQNGLLFIHVQEAKFPYTLSLNLVKFQQQFPHPDLVRINRSCVVNLKHVTKFNRTYVWVNANPVIIGETYRKAFMDSVCRLTTVADDGAETGH
ncbi:DNA-binding response regulator, LytR/AlgR family [Catalinimonas alkaloidigena]|uniref:DNA-binding response regulator, LytR/AlgR family n=1 Tax=Catalinimonas alkaloidigena TaxID=1075417 RepID=A0A1G9T2C0_9BACT|nr:response regulator transcription factor [Catalinimonas alkaloidigena]SDM41883.1 DNA-binding response regulator, LytR/AlgR family [Catalinimonas alkaloidigena]